MQGTRVKYRKRLPLATGRRAKALLGQPRVWNIPDNVLQHLPHNFLHLRKYEKRLIL